MKGSFIPGMFGLLLFSSACFSQERSAKNTSVPDSCACSNERKVYWLFIYEARESAYNYERKKARDNYEIALTVMKYGKCLEKDTLMQKDQLMVKNELRKLKHRGKQRKIRRG
jgi:hypothetical protein